MKTRLNTYLSPELYDRVDAAARKQGLAKAAIIEAAVASFFSPDAADRREAVLVRRLDRLTRQLERVERDLAIATETTALFVRFWLATTPPVPESAAAALRAQGQERYRGFVETLGRRLQRGNSLVREVSEEIWPDQPASAAARQRPAPDAAARETTDDDRDAGADDGAHAPDRRAAATEESAHGAVAVAP